MSHSKRNTALAFFTAHERAELRGTWGTQATRLTRESFLPFGSCRLCLLPAREPVACASHGHLFCRECAVSNLLAQTQELKRLKREAEQRRREDEEDKVVEDEEARAKEVERFERMQAGLNGGDGARGVKRKAEVDSEERRPQLESEKRNDAKRRAAAEEDGEKDSRERPSFWIPSQLPENSRRAERALKQSPTCPAAEPDAPHAFTLKGLVTVHFSDEDKTERSADSPKRRCPSCDKALSNASKAILAKPCGHVLCKSCSDKFQRPPEKSAHDTSSDDQTVRCYVCQEDITPGRKVKQRAEGEGHGTKDKKSKIDRGLVELRSEGTGFAGGGQNMVKKHGLAFQC